MNKILIGLLCLLLSAVPALAQPFQPPFDAPTVNATATIAVGNTFQTVLAAVANPANNAAARHSLTIQNNNAADSCWIVIGGVLGSATKGIAILLIPGASYTRYYPFIPSDAIHATCASNSDTLYVDTQ